MLWSWRSPSICSSTAQIKAGEILTFSILYLNVMAPLNEIHRFIDEAHESSLRVGDLLGLLAEPVDLSFESAAHREPRLVVGEPLFVTSDLAGRIPRRR